jgi:hypothetical protein
MWRSFCLRGAGFPAALALDLAGLASDVRRRLRAIARDPSFREAVAWQNRGALEGSIAAFERDASESETRRREQLVAKYVQRYAVKNDSIGFFGPVVWGEHDADETRARPGPAATREGRVYLERWGIEAIADALAAKHDLLRWLTPRRAPMVRVEGSTLHLPGREVRVSRTLAAILGAADGVRTTLEIGRVAGIGERETFDAVAQLTERKLLLAGLEVPSETVHPERALSDLARRIDDPAVAGPIRDVAVTLEDHRSAIARASGKPDEVISSLDALDRAFGEWTGRGATQRSGQTYAGRTLVYEDRVRDFDLRIGPAIIDRLGPPLELVLESARWFTHRVADLFRGAISEAFARAQSALGRDVVDYPTFAVSLEDGFGQSFPQADGRTFIRTAAEELWSRWADVLHLASTHGTVERSTCDLRSRAREAFAAPGPGWPSARHHSPDVAIRAAGPEALRAGRVSFVLGELHAGYNTLLSPIFVERHPHPEQIGAMEERDLGGPRIAPVLPKSVVHRAQQRSYSPNAFHLEMGTTRSDRPRDRVLPASAFVVRRRPEGVRIGTRDGAIDLDVAAFFEAYLMSVAIEAFAIVPPERDSPRITVDDLTVTRERWCFSAEALGSIVGTRSDRVDSVRRWAGDAGIPRFTFYRVPAETKPIYLDLESPPLVEIFAKAVRGSAWVRVTEMLPSHDELWLEDAAGRRYTSEIRLAFVDPIAFHSP